MALARRQLAELLQRLTRSPRINGRHTQAALAALAGFPKGSTGMAQLFAPSVHASGSGRQSFIACSRTRLCPHNGSVRRITASYNQFSSSSMSRSWVPSVYDGSRSLPEVVTRTVLSVSSAMISSGVSPAGMAAFSTAVRYIPICERPQHIKGTTSV